MIIFALIQRLLALASVAMLAGGVYLLYSWRRQEELVRAVDPDLDPSNHRLYWAIGLLLFAFLGRWLVLLVLGRGDGAPRNRSETQTVLSGHGKDALNVEIDGPENAPTLIFTHGWGLDSTMWREARTELGQRYRIVVWDLPGLGRSRRSPGHDLTIDRYAEDLKRVVEAVGRGPVILVGHSIGGMIVQTLCARHADRQGGRIAGIVLANTSHTDPTKTMIAAPLWQAIRPGLVALMRFDNVIWPLVWAMNWQSYWSGMTHVAFRVAGYARRPLRRELDHAALLATRHSPAVQVQGNLAMMHWSVTDALPRLCVPTLVFVGDKDIVTLPGAGETIASSIRGAKLVTVDQAGHMGPFEAAGVYNAAIAAFADEVFTQGARWADGPPSSALSAFKGDSGSQPDGWPPEQPRL